MKKRFSKKMGKKIISVLLAVAVVVSAIGTPSCAAKNKDELVIVSLGDSYSSGEGIEPFFGQSDGLPEKLDNDDWLAHRSELAWPVLVNLQLNNNEEIKIETVKSANSLKDLPGGEELRDKRGKTWFFVASSGAVTDNLKNVQHRDYKKGEYVSCKHEKGKTDKDDLPAQLDVFEDNNLNGKVDYVTITIGGNDAGFSNLMREAATRSSHLNPNLVPDIIDFTWVKFVKKGGIRDNLIKAYSDISDKAGKQAKILVAGYPELLSSLRSVLYSKSEAEQINDAVIGFNKKINEIVDNCQKDGINIEFVSVEDKFKEHKAYSLTPYINPIKFNKEQDWMDSGMTSTYSIHPNKAGAWAYAQCVYEKIQELEGNTSSNKTNKDTVEENIALSQDEIDAGRQALIQKVYEVNNIYREKGAGDESYIPYISAYVHDIDKNGIPEIFIEGISSDSPYSYAYSNKSIKELPCKLGSNSELYAYEDCVIMVDYGLQVGDGMYVNIYTYSDGKTTLKTSYWASNYTGIDGRPTVYDLGTSLENVSDKDEKKQVTWNELQNALSKYNLKAAYEIQPEDNDNSGMSVSFEPNGDGVLMVPGSGDRALLMVETDGNMVIKLPRIESAEEIVDAINQN